MQIPMEIYDEIVYRVWNADNLEFIYMEDDARHYSINRSCDRKWLAKLRLVNKAFCRSMSPWLFRHIRARSSSDPEISSLERLMALSTSPYAKHTCQIDFGFPSSSSLSDAHRLYIEDLAGCKSSLLANFTNLRALDFDEAPSWLPQTQRSAYMETVVSILRYLPLPKLEELVVRFPITHDFGRFFPDQTSSLQIPIEDIVQKLRRLELHVCAYTDTVDQRYWHEPVLPEYAALPNTAYEPQVFRMIEIAPNLESLSLSSRNILNIDIVDFPSTLCLRSLALTGISVSSHVLIALVKQSARKIKYISFTRVKLKSGTWEQVLRQMCKLPRLLDAHIEMCGYSSTGSSSHLELQYLPMPDVLLNIETEHSRDLPALGLLQWQVNSHRVDMRLKPFPDRDYRHMDRALDLETWL